MITAIDITPFTDYRVVGNKSGNLDNLTKVNLFVGSNNSGKSRFMRKLLLNELSIQLSEVDTSGLVTLVKKLKFDLLTILNPYGPNNREIQNARTRIENIPEPAFISEKAIIFRIRDEIGVLSQVESNVVSDGYGVNLQQVFSSLRAAAKPYLLQIESYIKKHGESTVDYSKVYIPILRGLRPLQIEGEPPRFDPTHDNYRLRIERDYQIEKKHGIDIHTGLDMYRNVTELLLGDHDDRLKIQAFEEYLSVTFFQGQSVHIVPRSGRDAIYIKIGDDKQYPIYELGEGVQSVILLTYSLFFNEGKRMVFFIEEPELHLHPGLERVFLETLRNERFASFQYFITTHSNHLLDFTIEYDDIAVYSFEKKKADSEAIFTIANVNSNHKQLLELLGVRNSSVFLSNCTIWVEGITDRLYLRQFLAVVQRERRLVFKEDFHYSFVEYAGNNITHWSFLESDDAQFANINVEALCSKIFLIADNDGVALPSKRSKEKKLQRRRQLEQKLGDHFYVTQGMEMENMLSKDVVRKVVLEMEGPNDELDFSAFNARNYEKHYLGDFIEKYVKGLKRKYSSDYGTVYDKLNFCKKAAGYIQSADDLSTEAQELAVRLLNFISKANQ
ncbi:MAG TPA: AAA family ATPase [Flavisolibacter sp.]|jgi:hypothetical protein|nr:AAA family ATPase [Flavisolibacter sp.]